MKRFSEFLKEADPRCADQFPSDLDADFIRSAVKPTSFNLDAKEFRTNDHKKEIRYITSMLFFPKIKNIEKLFVPAFNLKRVQNSINSLRNAHPDGFERFALKAAPKGVGPGEILLYFIIDGATMGGGSSAGVDMIVGDKQYEIKGADYHITNNYIHDFKLGGTKSAFKDVANTFMALKEKAMQVLPEVKWGTEEVGVSGGDVNIIKQLAEKDPEIKKQYKEARNKFIETAQGYLSSSIFFLQKNKGPYQMGQLWTIPGNLKPENIDLERISQGVPKPVIYLK